MESNDDHGTEDLKRFGAKFLGVVLLIVGALATVSSWGPLRNLFAEYQDSPASTYLLFGLPLLIGGLAMIAVGFWLLSRDSGR
ncbi:MAG: hypothetical protein J0H98_00050 [Solirubrobacterales bacterium]|nr:hypothetical protein [Solirubrobacterales bacterium]